MTENLRQLIFPYRYWADLPYLTTGVLRRVNNACSHQIVSSSCSLSERTGNVLQNSTDSVASCLHSCIIDLNFLDYYTDSRTNIRNWARKTASIKNKTKLNKSCKFGRDLLYNQEIKTQIIQQDNLKSKEAKVS